MNVGAGAATQDQPAERPVDDADAADITGTEYEVGAFRGFADAWDVARIMGKIGIHFEDELVAPFKCPFKTGDVGPAQSLFSLSVEDVDSGIRRGHFVEQLAGPVGGVVVNEQNVRFGTMAENGPSYIPDIFLFVIGWDDNQGVVHA